jgi:hypothetical protein
MRFVVSLQPLLVIGHGRPDDNLFDDTRYEVVIMAGLPGAGKSTWIAARLAGWPVVSLDQGRIDLSIGPEDEQGPVIARVRTLARAYLHAGGRSSGTRPTSPGDYAKG